MLTFVNNLFYKDSEIWGFSCVQHTHLYSTKLPLSRKLKGGTLGNCLFQGSVSHMSKSAKQGLESFFSLN